VRLVPSEEQTELARTAGALLHELASPALLDPEAGHLPFAADAWASCADLGLFGLGLPAALGGVGYGAFEQALVFREIARWLPPIGLLATTLAVHLAAGAGDHALLAQVLEGRLRVALGQPEVPGAVVGGGINGDLVTFGFEGADAVLVVDGSDAALIAAGALAPGDQGNSIDPVIDVTLASVDGATALAASSDGAVRCRAELLCAALLTGVAEAACDASVAYVGDRVQFDRPLGSFQAVKHRCADMAARAEVGLAATLYAARLLDLDDDTSFQHALAARIVAADAALLNAGDNIQNHGGMGFTYEAGQHLFVRRAHVLTAMLGGQASAMHGLLDASAPLAMA
jgi:alkylation response protein AidB-like acyl-CoA dehydrogenase